jgi:NAD(P)-dependent dehydrogenase (short-subunit alcohol dehydrogenase family)
VVTGGSSGIGRGLAEALARSGARVAVIALDTPELSATEGALRAEGLEVMALAADVADEHQVGGALRRVRAQWGPATTLVHAAGIFFMKDLISTAPADWDRMMRTNVRGFFVVAQSVLPQMVEAGEGALLSLSSHWATKGGVDRSAYITSKASVLALTRCIAAEFGSRGVRANALCPGPVVTPMTVGVAGGADTSGWLTVADLVPTALFLLSSDAAHINGESVTINAKGAPIGM